MKHRSWLGRWQFIILQLLIVSCLWVSFTPSAYASSQLEKLNEIFTLIEQSHVSGISSEQLFEAAITGILNTLNDPYTSYYNEQEWQTLQQRFQQTYVGIGIQFVETKQGLRIKRVYPGSSAHAAGLNPGEIITGVAGQSIAGKATDEVLNLILGAENTAVELNILKVNGKETYKITLIRRSFTIPTVEYKRLDNHIGYILITSFTTDTPQQVADALATLKVSTPIKGLIVDLRGNPGGYLQSVLDVMKSFLTAGQVMQSIDRNGLKQAYEITGGKQVGVPTVVLVDENSASASEIFAGAMQDYDLAQIIGTNTFGKGSVQQLIPLQTGGGLKVTIEHYLTPKGNKVDGIGILPDVKVADPLKQVAMGLNHLGTSQFQVELTEYGTFINQGAFDTLVPVIRERQRIYIQATSLASLMAGNTTWNQKTRQLRLQTSTYTETFGLNNGLLLRDGKSYLAMDALTKEFPSLKIRTTTDSIILEWRTDGHHSSVR